MTYERTEKGAETRTEHSELPPPSPHLEVDLFRIARRRRARCEVRRGAGPVARPPGACADRAVEGTRAA